MRSTGAQRLRAATAGRNSDDRPPTDTLNRLTCQFNLDGGFQRAAPRMVQERAHPVTSPAKMLGKKLASAFGGPVTEQGEW